MATALEKNRIALERAFGVSRWRVCAESPDREQDRDPLAPDWWTDDADASDSSLLALGIDLAAMDAAAARAREGGS